jgi:hypothetical protein
MNCGDGLDVFGSDREAKHGTSYRAMLFVCPYERVALLPRDVPSSLRDVLEALRAYVRAARDADALDLVERSHWGT